MNISLYTQASYSNARQNTNSVFRLGNMSSQLKSVNMPNNTNGSDTLIKAQEKRNLIRNLQQTSDQNNNPYATVSEDKENGFLKLSGSPDSAKNKTPKANYKYSYKEVSTKIQRAKTSVSAGQAVLSAKRKVLEVKRKMASGNGDSEELQLALTHAKRMEMVARKKKHHLELEEMVTATQKRDERQDKLEEAASDMQNALIGAAEEKVTDAEDAIFEERDKMLDAITDNLAEGTGLSQEMLANLNEMIAEFGEEELEALEESMEQLENMEVLDPHMSKEDLENLKRKHRNSENKAIIKANMDYLKGMIKHELAKGAGLPGMSQGSQTGISMPSVGASASIDVAVPSTADVSVPSIDIQV